MFLRCYSASESWVLPEPTVIQILITPHRGIWESQRPRAPRQVVSQWPSAKTASARTEEEAAKQKRVFIMGRGGGVPRKEALCHPGWHC